MDMGVTPQTGRTAVVEPVGTTEPATTMGCRSTPAVMMHEVMSSLAQEEVEVTNLPPELNKHTVARKKMGLGEDPILLHTRNQSRMVLGATAKRPLAERTGVDTRNQSRMVLGATMLRVAEKITELKDLVENLLPRLAAKATRLAKEVTEAQIRLVVTRGVKAKATRLARAATRLARVATRLTVMTEAVPRGPVRGKKGKRAAKVPPRMTARIIIRR